MFSPFHLDGLAELDVGAETPAADGYLKTRRRVFAELLHPAIGRAVTR